MKRALVLVAVLAMTGAAYGDILGNTPDPLSTWGAAAQDFETAYDIYDVWVVSDFETAVDYYLNDIVVQGFENSGLGLDGHGANFDIWNGLPWGGGAIVMSASGGYDTLGSAGTFGADFTGQELAAGSYYMVFQPARDYATSGQSYAFVTGFGNNNDYQWNPGEGFGSGPYFEVSNDLGNPTDVNWQLNAEPVPEPATLSLLALGALVLIRRR